MSDGTWMALGSVGLLVAAGLTGRQRSAAYDSARRAHPGEATAELVRQYFRSIEYVGPGHGSGGPVQVFHAIDRHKGWCLVHVGRRADGLLEVRSQPLPKGSRKIEKMPSSRERRRRLREAALAGQRGRKWYHKAEEQIRTVAKAWGVDPIYAAVAVAATSPATPVISSPRMARGGGMASNIGKARRVIKRQALHPHGSDALHPLTPGMGRLIDFERCVDRGEDPPECLAVAFPKPDRMKTHSFVRNLIGYEDPVTVDTLIARGVGVPVSPGGTVRVTEARHAAVAEDIKAVAKQLGWEPREVMAAAWTAWGGSGDLGLATSAERARVKRGNQ